MNQPLVSVLMPVYNASEYVLQAIDSIINQTHESLELIICDDSSSDNSLEIISSISDPRIRIFKQEENQGYLKTCNFLFAKAKGDYITFQDADDWSDLQRLSIQLQNFREDPELGICGTVVHYYDKSGTRFLREKKGKLTNSGIREAILDHNQFCGASIMIPRHVLEQMGYYHDYFDRIANEDYEWSARIVERFKAKNVDQPLYFVRSAPNSITRNIRSDRQLITSKLVSQIIQQRRYNGLDLLNSSNHNELIRLEQDLLRPYQEDPSLKFREAADLYWFNKEIKVYRESAYMAFITKPTKWINLKYFIHAIVRSIRS